MLDERDVGAGPAHVEGDEVPLAEEPRAVAAPRHAPRGPGQDRAGGEPDGVGDRRHAAVGLDDEDRAGVARLDEALGQAREVARERGADVGVDDGRADPLVLLDLGQHLRGERDVGARQRPAKGALASPARAARPGRRAGSRRRPPRRPRAGGRRSRGRGRARSSGVSTRPSARMRSRTPSRRARGTSGLRRRHAEVVPVVLEPLPHLDHVAVPGGREEPDARALPLEEGVGRDGRPVDDALGVAEEGRPVASERLGEEARAPP